ncbi:cytochrome P450 [soil metagenome]
MTVDNHTRRFPTVFDAGLPELDYWNTDNPEEAHRLIRQARDRSPIALGPHGPEILSYPLVRSVIRDPRFGVPRGLFLASQGVTSGPLWDKAVLNLLDLDGPAHTRLRRLVSKAFTPRSTARLQTIITDVITGLVTPLQASGHCDVVRDIARPYPVPIICALLGAPPEDSPLFSLWADAIFQLFSWDALAHEHEILFAYAAFDAYIDEMVDERRLHRTDDLISELIRAEEDGDRLSTDEMCMMAQGLLLAGTDTTRNQLAAAVQVLCEHPEQWAFLAAHPELMARAVDELLRHSPVAFSTIRVALEDVAVGGVSIPAGTQVVVSGAAANRDPAVFANPEKLDVTRENASAMVTFGGGVHYCLGANLAKSELVQALTVLTRRLQHPRLAGPAPWKPLVGITGPVTLPIEFDLVA